MAVETTGVDVMAQCCPSRNYKAAAMAVETIFLGCTHGRFNVATTRPLRWPLKQSASIVLYPQIPVSNKRGSVLKMLLSLLFWYWMPASC